MNYIVDDEFGGVPEGDKYQVADTPETAKEWKALLSDFAKRFSEFTAQNHRDFDFADWHYGMRALCAYLYNQKFYNDNFIPDVQDILRNQKRPSYAQFECFDDSRRLCGRFMVFNKSVIFDQLAEESGLLNKFVGT